MRRHFTTDPSCFHCPGTPETLLHLFRDCPKAMLVWSAFYIPPSMATSFSLDWNAWLYINLQQEKCFHMNSPWNIFFSFTCWFIWKWRCKCIFDSRFNLPFDMKGIISNYMNEWAAASIISKEIQPMQTVMLHWKKPAHDIIKINVDGSLNSTGNIGDGGVMRDFSGAWKGGFMINIGSGGILLAEVWAVYYGLHLASQKGYQNIKLESDSATLVKLLNEGDFSVHPLGTIIMNCHTLASNFSSCSFQHIHREENFAADFLAKDSFKRDKGIIWLDAAPPDMAGILMDDIAGFERPRRVHALMPPYPSSPLNEHINADPLHAENEFPPNLHRQNMQFDAATVNLEVMNAPLDEAGSSFQPSSYG